MSKLIYTYSMFLSVGGTQEVLVDYINTKYSLEDYSMQEYSYVEKKMAAHSSILAWEIPWMEEPSRL